jgi:hypothetical protein
MLRAAGPKIAGGALYACHGFLKQLFPTSWDGSAPHSFKREAKAGRFFVMPGLDPGIWHPEAITGSSLGAAR